MSMQRVCNFGSVLQAYSLKKMLEELGNEVDFVDYELHDDDPVMLPTYSVQYKSENSGWSKSGISRYLSKIDKYSINRLVNRYRQYLQEGKLRLFQRDTLGVSNNKKECHYDLCIIGSDEVFNCLQGRYSRLTTELFGNVLFANKIITYAASCGFTTYDMLPKDFIAPIQKALRNISSFSVRDDNTKKFVNELIAPDYIEENFDPVLVGNFDTEISQVAISQKLMQPYCIIYSYANRIHSKSEIHAIQDFCHIHNFKIVSLGFQQAWIPDFVVTDPFEMLSLFRHASFVITDTFHGTIFSAKYASKFAVIIRSSNKNKLSDLLKKLDIENHVVSDMKHLEEVFTIDNNLKMVDTICKKQREVTIEYLKRNIY